MTAREHEATFLRPAEAAALAGLSTRAVYRAVQRGELAAVVREGAAFGGTGLCKDREA
jgi:predicted DNA-binding transcriptional regulator AlpA